MKEKTIDILKFEQQFNKEYKFLYDHNDKVAGYEEARDEFDRFAGKNQKFVSDFVKYRGDCISSDREAAAFMFALESMGGIE